MEYSLIITVIDLTQIFTIFITFFNMYLLKLVQINTKVYNVIQQHLHKQNSNHKSADNIKNLLNEIKITTQNIKSTAHWTLTSITEFQESLHFQIRNSEPDASRLCTIIHINGHNKLICVQPNMMSPAKLLQCFTTIRSSTYQHTPTTVQ